MKLPNDLVEVEEKQFKNFGIEILVIPSSVQTIGRNAFYRWGSLKKVMFSKNGALE